MWVGGVLLIVHRVSFVFQMRSPSVSLSPPTVTANQLYSYDAQVGNQTLHHFIQQSHLAMCKAYGWSSTPLKVGCFGYDNLACSIAWCYTQLIETITERSVIVEDAAAWVHDGWVQNYVWWRDQKPWKTNKAYTKPSAALGDERRDNLALTAYADLPEDEKEKDRVVASYVLANVKW